MAETDLPVQYFSCYAPTERDALVSFSGWPLIPPVFRFAFEVDAIFLLSLDAWWEVRRDAFVGNHGLEKETIEIEEVEVVVYFNNFDWALPLNIALAAGDLSPSMPRCIQGAFAPTEP